MALIRPDTFFFIVDQIPNRPLTQVRNPQSNFKPRLYYCQPEPKAITDRFKKYSVMTEFLQPVYMVDKATLAQPKQAVQQYILRRHKQLLESMFSQFPKASKHRQLRGEQIEDQDHYNRVVSLMDQLETTVVKVLLDRSKEEVLDLQKTTDIVDVKVLGQKVMKGGYLNKLYQIVSEDFFTVSRTAILDERQNSLDKFMNPLLSMFYPQLKGQHQAKKTVLLNFGRDSFLNLRGVTKTSQLLYISFFNQYSVTQKSQSFIQKTYIQMLEEEMGSHFGGANKMTVQGNESASNIMLFPLNLLVHKDGEVEVKDKSYAQFGLSEDIYYLFETNCVRKISEYQPQKIIVYYDGYTTVESKYFIEMVRQLSNICQNNILLVLNMQRCPKSSSENVMVNEGDEWSQKATQFIDDYMNYQLSDDQKELMLNHLVSFLNVTSKDFVPLVADPWRASQSLRGGVRTSYTRELLKLFPFMSAYFPKQTFKLEWQDKKLQPNIQHLQKTFDKLYSSDTDFLEKRTPICFQADLSVNEAYQCHRFLHGPKLIDHKYVLKGVCNNQKQLLAKIYRLRFFTRPVDNSKLFVEILLDQSIQVQVFEKQKHLIVLLINYWNGTRYEILGGKADAKSQSVLMSHICFNDNNGSQQKQKQLCVYTGYSACLSEGGKYLMLSWPLQVDVMKNYSRKARGLVYKPNVSDRVIRVAIEQAEKRQSNFGSIFDYQVLRRSAQSQCGPIYRSKLFAQDGTPPISPIYYAVGGVWKKTLESTFLEVVFDNLKESEYTIRRHKFQRPFMMPEMIDYQWNFHRLQSKDKTPIYSVVLARSPYFIAEKPLTFLFNQRRNEVIRQPNQQMSIPPLRAIVAQSGMFDTLRVYPRMQIVKKWFDKVLRFRSRVKLGSYHVDFDDVHQEPQCDFWQDPVEGFEESDHLVATRIKFDNKWKYLNFLFNNPIFDNSDTQALQPTYISLSPSSFVAVQTFSNKIIIRKGKSVYIQASDQRLRGRTIAYRGDLTEVVQNANDTNVYMEAVSIHHNTEQEASINMLGIYFQQMKISN